jgi:uncharacterized protein (DUF4415 family)
VSEKHLVKHSKKAKVPRPSRGRANLRLLKRITDAEIRRSAPEELPELPRDFWDSAVRVIPAGKVPISLRVDSDVLEWFREEGPKYQSRMNAVLRSYMERFSARHKSKLRSRPSNTR